MKPMLKLLALTVLGFVSLGVIGLVVERQGSQLPIKQAMATIKVGQRFQEAFIGVAQASARDFAIHCRGPRGFAYSRQLEADGRFTIEVDLRRDEGSYTSPSQWADALRSVFVKVGCDTATLEVGAAWAVDLRLDGELRVASIGELYYVD